MKIIFYDNTCGLCDKTVFCLLKWDRHQVFFFATLQGETAKRDLNPSLLSQDSVILLEKGVPLLRAKAIFRALWHLGGLFRIVGLLSFLPTWPFDQVYRFVAARRKALGCKRIKKSLNKYKDRFLP